MFPDWKELQDTDWMWPIHVPAIRGSFIDRNLEEFVAATTSAGAAVMELVSSPRNVEQLAI
jgi:hypothetical protein